MNETYEKCVLCGRLTSVQKSMPITKRRGYIEGCGQLCSHCFREYEALSPTYRITADISKYLKDNKM